MRVVVSARNCELTDGLRDAVDRQFGRLGRFEPRATRAEVRLTAEKKGCTADARVHVDGSGSLHASGRGSDPRSALDRAVDKLSRQLRRNHGKRVERGPSPSPNHVSEELEP